MIEFGKVLKRKREALGQSLRSASISMSMSHRTLSRIERGRVSFIKTSTAIKLCNYYNVEKSAVLDLIELG